MNALVKTNDARPLLPLVDILRILAASAASSWELFPLELADVVDPLQDFAERTKLVHAIGQDAVQEILSDAFAPYRLAELAEPEQAPLVPEPEPSKRTYRTPPSTVDAFFGWIIRQDEETQIRWLAKHPQDSRYLQSLLEAKCHRTSK
jgi:hypothetical protein